MSYLVLARKYRPRDFSEMVGQEHVVQALTNALTTQRLHHAYLFTGTRGVGKTTVSRILAKSLNCQGVDGQGDITATPCGVCPACSDIDAGRFVDYTELDAASNRGVDEVQTLLEQAVYKPVQGRFKVFMIDEVHMLTTTAFNAMLKTLEEPPEYLKFVLATTDPQKVPVTVLSRCLQFNLRPMAPETVREHLVHVLQTEGVPCEAQALRLLARAARGSMRDALSLTDQAIAFGAGALQESTVRQMLGSVDRSYVFRLLEALALGDGKVVIETVETLRLHGLSPASTLEEMSAILQRMAVLQIAKPSASNTNAVATEDDNDPDASDTARLAALMPADEIQLLYSICLHGRADLGLAPDEYAALTMVLLRLLAFKPQSTAPLAAAGARASNAAVLPEAEKKTLNNPSSAAAAPLVSEAPPLARLAPSEHAPALRALGSASPRVAPPGQILAVRDAPPSAASAAPVHGAAQDVAAPASHLVTEELHKGKELVAMAVHAHATAQVDSVPGTTAPVLQVTQEGDFWHATVQQLIRQGAITAMVRELASQSQLMGRDTGQWILRVERESLAQAGVRERLSQALQTAGFGVVLVLEVGPVTDSPARREAAAAAQRQLGAEKIIFDDPFVQAMMRDFGAKIVPGSIKPV